MTWSAWTLDWPTKLWLAWMVAFMLLEGWAVVSSQPQHTLTWHLRPLFVEHPLTWWLAVGVWLWLGVHFLAPAWEHRVLDFFVR